MDIIIEQESSLTAIAALSISASKADSDQKVANVQCEKIEYTKYAVDDVMSEMQNSPTNGCVPYFNMPVCEPMEITFKDLSYSVQKLFSKSE
jgi:hypothetical protein